MLRLLGRFRANQKGAITVEFAIVFPIYMWIILSVFEVGWYIAREAMLNRAMDFASRQIQIGTSIGTDYAEVKNLICRHAFVINDCDHNLAVEVAELHVDDPYPRNAPYCVDRVADIAPTNTFTVGGRNRIMFIRACAVVDPLFNWGVSQIFPKDPSGGYLLVTYGAFMNEPT